jgi:hypothetical protein
MPNRREFLQTGAAVSAVALNGVLARSAQAVGVRPVGVPQRAVYDDRYAEGHRFAAVLAAQGVAVQALDAGDVTRLYTELDALWRRERIAVAGLTQFGPLFVIEQLAAEHRMRVEHRVVVDGAPTQVASAPRETSTLAARARASMIHYYTPLAMQQGHELPLDGPLYSWLIAPRERG